MSQSDVYMSEVTQFLTCILSDRFSEKVFCGRRLEPELLVDQNYGERRREFKRGWFE
ncbi:MAG: hypothetical protein AAFW67_06940 [Cyanobacteria bacterium J06638_38]